MRFKSRGMLLALAVLAMSALAVSAASAATLPEFKPVPTKKKFTSAGGAVVWTFNNGTETMTCSNSTAAGEVTGAKTLGKLVVKFTGCETSGTKAHGCPVTSAGAKEGEIVTKALSGELGTVPTNEATSGVGILLKPETEKKWATLVGNACTEETPLTGSLAAEVPTIGKKQATNKLVISDPSNSQKIKEIKLDSGKEAYPELVSWGTTLIVAATDEVAFEEALEVS